MVGKLLVLAILTVVKALRSLFGVDLVDIAFLDFHRLLLLSCLVCMAYFEHVVKTVVEVSVVWLSDQDFPRHPLSISPFISLSTCDSTRDWVMAKPKIFDFELALILQSFNQVIKL